MFVSRAGNALVTHGTQALLSVFKGRILDPKGKDTTVDKCQVTLQDRPDEAECRLIIKMLSNQGDWIQ